MFNTPILDVVVGLCFCFAAISLTASAVTEALASLVKLRANTLMTGIRRLLNDPELSGLALKVYNHGLVHPLGDGKMRSGRRWWTFNAPSYMPSDQFATALIESLTQARQSAGDLTSAVGEIEDDQLRQVLQGMMNRAEGRAEDLHRQIAAWFDTAMDRVAGAYKRQAQLINFVIGLVMAACLNVDAGHLARELWRQPAIAKAITPDTLKPDSPASAALTALERLPIGPAAMSDCPAARPPGAAQTPFCLGGKTITVSALAGWLITALATLFGAPFWFDLLRSVSQLRGAGTRPEPTPPAPPESHTP